ncbi:MAG: long-chain fatty acid--CoA ligase [Burkholderiales bacterium]
MANNTANAALKSPAVASAAPPSAVRSSAVAAGRTLPQGDTLAKRFWGSVQLRGERIALRQKDFGLWDEVTWREYGEHARRIAMGLAELGFQPGDTAAIISNTRREWVYADWGVLSAGGVSVGIYPTDAPEQVEYVVQDASVSILFVENEEQLDKYLEIRERCPTLRKVVVFDMEGLHRFQDETVTSLEALEDAGEVYGRTHPGELDRRIASGGPDDLAILVYTSGTTGKPKGAMISNRNLTSVMDTHPLLPEENDDKVTYLPMCHIAERMIGSLLSVQGGGRMNFVENPDTLALNICEIAPTIFLGVPRIWEKFYSSLAIKMKEATTVGKWAYALALRIGMRAADERLAGRRPGPLLALANGLASLLVLGNVRRMMGLHRLRLANTGAAPISPELIRWYHAIGVPLFEGWGMTETAGGGTMNTPAGFKLGTIGKPIAVNEIKLSSQGEILVRGANVVMGYLNQPEKTREAIDEDGWLHTGDVATIDADGYYRIIDRMKDIIITAGGKNITPSEIENELKFSPYIADAVIIGDRRAYLTCLVMIDHETIEQYAQERSVPFSSFASLCQAKEVIELIQQEVDRVNKKFARVEQLKYFRLIEHKLTAEDEELTATMKLKRKVVERKYAPLIDSMYASAK